MFLSGFENTTLSLDLVVCLWFRFSIRMGTFRGEGGRHEEDLAVHYLRIVTDRV